MGGLGKLGQLGTEFNLEKPRMIIYRAHEYNDHVILTVVLATEPYCGCL